MNWTRNNQQKSPNNKFVAGLGLHWELGAADDIFDLTPEHGTTHYVDLSVGYVTESVFFNLTENGCDQDVSPVYSQAQHKEAIQASITYSPFNGAWELQNDGISMSFAPGRVYSGKMFWTIDLLPINRSKTAGDSNFGVQGAIMSKITNKFSPEVT